MKFSDTLAFLRTLTVAMVRNLCHKCGQVSEKMGWPSISHLGHMQCNGQVARVNQELVHFLCTECKKNQRDWLFTCDIHRLPECCKINAGYMKPFEVLKQVKPITYTFKLPSHCYVTPTFQFSQFHWTTPPSWGVPSFGLSWTTHIHSKRDSVFMQEKVRTAGFGGLGRIWSWRAVLDSLIHLPLSTSTCTLA